MNLSHSHKSVIFVLFFYLTCPQTLTFPAFLAKSVQSAVVDKYNINYALVSEKTRDYYINHIFKSVIYLYFPIPSYIFNILFLVLLYSESKILYLKSLVSFSIQTFFFGLVSFLPQSGTTASTVNIFI